MRNLRDAASECAAAKSWRETGATSLKHARNLFRTRLQRGWGIFAQASAARLLLSRLQYVGPVVSGRGLNSDSQIGRRRAFNRTSAAAAAAARGPRVHRGFGFAA